MRGIPIVVIPHPLAGNKPDAVQRKAEAVAEEIIAILTQPAEKLAHDYRERFLKPVGQQGRKATA